MVDRPAPPGTQSPSVPATAPAGADSPTPLQALEQRVRGNFGREFEREKKLRTKGMKRSLLRLFPRPLQRLLR